MQLNDKVHWSWVHGPSLYTRTRLGNRPRGGVDSPQALGGPHPVPPTGNSPLLPETMAVLSSASSERGLPSITQVQPWGRTALTLKTLRQIPVTWSKTPNF